MNEELNRYVYESLKGHVSRDTITAQLKTAGWRTEDIAGALKLYNDADPNRSNALPVPVRKPTVSAREVLQYLMLFLTLCIAAFATGNLAFNALDALVPDPNQPYNVWSSSQVNLALASLIVSAPIYLYLSRLTSKSIAADPAKRESTVRKWVSYLMLFIAGATAIGDLIQVLYNLLQGDFPANYFGKLAVVLLLAGSIFWYYLTDLRKDETSAA